MQITGDVSSDATTIELTTKTCACSERSESAADVVEENSGHRSLWVASLHLVLRTSCSTRTRECTELHRNSKEIN